MQPQLLEFLFYQLHTGWYFCGSFRLVVKFLSPQLGFHADIDCKLLQPLLPGVGFLFTTQTLHGVRAVVLVGGQVGGGVRFAAKILGA